jgi:hypothetical protein
MHGDHSRKQPFYQQVRKLHPIYTTPQNYSSRKLQATILHHETSSENLQIYKLNILRTTASEIYSKISREFLQQNSEERIYNREVYSIWKSTDLHIHHSTRLQHRKSTAISAENFYSQNSEERESTTEKTTASENLQQNQQRISTAKQQRK